MKSPPFVKSGCELVTNQARLSQIARNAGNTTLQAPVEEAERLTDELRDIVLTIGRVIGRPDLIQLGALPARANDAALVVGENARLLSEVGWQQRFDLETGLCRTIGWWKDQAEISI